MVRLANGCIILNESEKEIFNELKIVYDAGGKYLYAERRDGDIPLYYVAYSGEENPRDRHYVGGIYGCSVECLNAVLKEKLFKRQSIFEIDEVLKAMM